MEEEVAVTMFETDKYSSAVKQGAFVDQCFSCLYSLAVFVVIAIVLFD